MKAEYNECVFILKCFVYRALSTLFFVVNSFDTRLNCVKFLI